MNTGDNVKFTKNGIAGEGTLFAILPKTASVLLTAPMPSEGLDIDDTIIVFRNHIEGDDNFGKPMEEFVDWM